MKAKGCIEQTESGERFCDGTFGVNFTKSGKVSKRKPISDGCKYCPYKCNINYNTMEVVNG